MFSRFAWSARNLDWNWPFTRTSKHYQRAQNVDTTELHNLTAKNQDNISINTSHTSRTSPAHYDPVGSGRAEFIQHYRQRLSGWRFGTLNFATWACLVFLINLIVTIWGSAAQRANRGVLSEGDCERIKTLNSGIHILINILSTILLSGSNYCMQCLSAPTRGEIEKAHTAGTWLDVGIPSLRNLRHINRRRLVLWLLLGLSSLPLHLLYNSAVYTSLSTNDYNIYLVSQAFLDDTECRNCTDQSDYGGWSPTRILESLWDMSKNGSLDRFEPTQCLTEYATMIQANRRNLLLVTANENVDARVNASGIPLGHPTNSLFNNTHLYWFDSFYAEYGLDHYEAADSYRWICSATNDTETPCSNQLEQVKRASQWMMTDGCVETNPICQGWIWPVDYCLSEPAVPRCKLHFNTAIAIVVTILNLLKAVLMFYILKSTKEDPLMTMGDAVASFIDEPDSTTENMGLLSIQDCKRGYKPGATTWQNPQWRWKDVTSVKRRTVTLLLFATAWIVVLALLIWGTIEINNNGSPGTSAILRFGFGAVDPRALISGPYFPSDMGRLALIANLPQVLLSFLYFAYNGLFTAMLMGYEWTSYAFKKKGLRVSRRPSGSQRSTYFLQLPYRFGLPLVILSGTLHWLVSQSIFVVAIDVYDAEGILDVQVGLSTDAANKTCGYSPIAMLTVVILGVLMFAAVIGFGHIPYKRGMPLAGSSSLAISAACHPDHKPRMESELLAVRKLQWGVVSTSRDEIGHCAFSSEEVGPLLKGRTYA